MLFAGADEAERFQSGMSWSCQPQTAGCGALCCRHAKPFGCIHLRHVCGDHDGNYAMVMGGMRMSLRLKMRMKLGITPRPEGGAPTLRQGTQACANITRTTQDNFTKPLRNDLLAVGRGAVGCIPESAKEWPGMPAIVPYDGCEL